MSPSAKDPFTTKFHFSDALWDLWCVASIIGIWPRFVEPSLLLRSKHWLKITDLPPALKGLKIVHFSDLHLQNSMSSSFLEKLSRKIAAEKPDILVFTGDFICYSQLAEDDRQRLSAFLNTLKARYGCYAVFGNHDYAEYVSVNQEGEYDLLSAEKERSLIKRGFERLFSTTRLAKRTTPRAQAVVLHESLAALLKNTPFQILENKSQLLSIKGSFLNICGLGEYTLGKTQPEQAFQSYDKRFPGIVLLHNPDGIPLLKDSPGEIILCGHTHGGQVNLPWMWKKFTLLENPQFKSGLIRFDKRWVYVNRGIGSIIRFRWFAPPEVAVLTLV